MKCLECGAPMKTAAENYNYKESGLSCVTLVELHVARCEECGKKEVEIPAIEQLHALISRTLVLKPAKLMPEEVRFLRKQLGLSQADLAGRLGVAIETISRWENGKMQMTVSTERFLRLLAAKSQPVESYEKELYHMAVSKAACSKFRLQRSHETWRALRAA